MPSLLNNYMPAPMLPLSENDWMALNGGNMNQVVHNCKKINGFVEKPARETGFENPYRTEGLSSILSKATVAAPSLLSTAAAINIPAIVPRCYFTSRISFSFTAQRSSIFLVSECVSFSSSSTERLLLVFADLFFFFEFLDRLP